MGDTRTGFRPDIEGLRGVAVLLVVLGHLTGWPRGGFVGVDVFFVISGYLITGLLVAERERTGRISLRRFYLRRVRRLLPAGLLVLAVTDLAATLLLLPTRAHATVVDSGWAAGFLANVRFARLGTDYFSLTRAPSAVQHYWSLSVEEQFYVLWPCLVLAAFAAGGRRAVGRVAALAVALSLTWSVVSTGRSPGAAYFSSPARAWELGAGALLVLAGRRLPGRLAWLGAAGLVASVVVITPSTAVPGYALVLPVLSTVAILGAGGTQLGLALAPVRYVGAISYSLYLWHWPVIVLGGTLPGGTTAPGRAGLLVLALLLSVTSHHLVEQPFRVPHRKRWPPRRGLARAAAPSYPLALVGLLTAAWLLSGAAPPAVPALAPAGGEPALRATVAEDLWAGLALRAWPQGLDARLHDAGAPEWIHDKCLDVSGKNVDRCVYGPADATRSVALLGDSVGVSWMPALRRAAEVRRARVHVLTRRQCPNVRGLVSPACTDHQDWAIGAVQQLRPDLVVLSARYEGRASPEQWRDGTIRMIAAVSPYARHVVVLAPPPDTANLQSCFTRSSTPPSCVRPVTERYAAYSTAERTAAVGRAEFVDPRDWFCLHGRCPAVVADLPVMFDGRHLAAEFAARLAPQMEGMLSIM